MKTDVWSGPEREKEIMNTYEDIIKEYQIDPIPAAILATGCIIASILSDFDHQIAMGIERKLDSINYMISEITKEGDG